MVNSTMQCTQELRVQQCPSSASPPGKTTPPEAKSQMNWIVARGMCGRWYEHIGIRGKGRKTSRGVARTAHVEIVRESGRKIKHRLGGVLVYFLGSDIFHLLFGHLSEVEVKVRVRGPCSERFPKGFLRSEVIALFVHIDAELQELISSNPKGLIRSGVISSVVQSVTEL